MKYASLFLLTIIFLTSCAAPATLAPTQTSTPEPTVTQTPTQTPSPTSTITPTPTQIGGGSGSLIFEYYKAAYEKSFPNLKGSENVFTANWDGTNLMPVTNGLEGFDHIESISKDGQMALISLSDNNYSSKNSDLYLVHLNQQASNPIKLASGLDYPSGSSQAIFFDNSQVVYIGLGPEGRGFYTVNIDGTNKKRIGGPVGENGQWGLLASDETRVYWFATQKESFEDSTGLESSSGDFQTLWWVNIDGSGQGKLESNGKQIIPKFGLEGNKFAISPDSTSIAWIPAQQEPGCSLFTIFWSPWVRDGTYTKWFSKEKITIDTNYADTQAHNCNILHVASLSDLNNDIKIPLIPPYDPTKDDFLYHKDYGLTWWPDNSKILLYDNGNTSLLDDLYYNIWGAPDHYPISLYDVSPKDANPKLTLLKVLSNSPAVQPGRGAIPYWADSFGSFNFSPDGRQLLFAKFSNDNQASMIKILDLETTNYVDDLIGNNLTPDLQIQRIGNIYWLP